MSDRPQAIPSAHLLQSIASARLTWLDALGEWLDNSFGASSSSVELTFSRDSLTIQDNGCGCSNLAVFATLGDSRPHATRGGCSRFGRGSKDAALWVGGIRSTLRVASVQGGKKRTLDINWDDMARDNWAYDPVGVCDAEPGDCGTRIVVAPIVRRVPDGAEWDQLVADLGYLYAPAIKQGKQITVRARRRDAAPQLVPGWRLPRLEGDPIDARIVVNGKSARVYCGVVAEGEPNPRRGLTYSYGNRVIVRAGQRGCGSYNISRICGFVDLGPEWLKSLTTNKNAINSDEDELYAKAEEACRPVLDRAARVGMAMASAAFESAVTSLINARLRAANARAKRNPPENRTGAKRPTGTGTKHRDAARKQEGRTFGAGELIRIVHDHHGADKGIGEFKPPVVYLNEDNPAIAQAYREQNVLATAFAVASLISADHAFAPDGTRQMVLKGVRNEAHQPDTFNIAMGAILTDGLAVDGRQPLRAIP